MLAHELGHFKHRHVVKRIAGDVRVQPGRLRAAGLAGERRSGSTRGLGVQPNLAAPNDALALLLFLLAVPPFRFFVSPLMALLSRRHEFEADAYACAQASGARPGQRAAEAARGQRVHADARSAVRALLLLASAGRLSASPRCASRALDGRVLEAT